MNYGDLENELSRLRAGRLLDEHLAEGQMLGSTNRAVVSLYLRTTNRVLGRRTSPIERMPKVAKRAIRTLGAKLAPTALTTFHFRATSVARPRSASGLPGSVTRGERVAVYPSNSREFAIVNRNKAVYSNRERVFTVPAGRRFLRTRIGQYLQTKAAEVARHYWLSQRSVSAGRQSPIDFQSYIDRSNLPDEERSRELAADKSGYISFGTLGATPHERVSFWSHVDRHETREGARIQSRIEAELPHWLSPEDGREIAERLCQLFVKRGLPYWCAVHLPGPDGDTRNYHLHIVWHDRPVIGQYIECERLPDGSQKWRPIGPIFATEKDRDVQKKHWVERLRTNYADIVNDVIGKHAIRTGQRPPHYFYPGTNEDLGIRDIPQRHLGPRRSAIERSGRASNRGIQNELAIRHRLSLTEAEASAELLRYVEVLGNPEAFGLKLWEGKKKLELLPLRTYVTMNKAWDAARGIAMLSQALENEKSEKALEKLIGELEGAGYVVPQGHDLPDLPIIRGRDAEPDEEPTEGHIPTHGQPFDKGKLDDALIRRYCQILVTAHIYFLSQLNDARHEFKRMVFAYVDPRRLPSREKQASRIARDPITMRQRENVRAIGRLVSVIRSESKKNGDRTTFLAPDASKVVNAVIRAANAKRAADQVSHGANQPGHRKSKTVELFLPQKVTLGAVKKDSTSMGSSRTPSPLSAQKPDEKPALPSKVNSQSNSPPPQSITKHGSARWTHASKPISSPKLIDMDRDLPRPIADYDILIALSKHHEFERIYNFLRSISSLELCFTKFQNEELLKSLEGKRKPYNEIIERILKNGPEMLFLLRDAFQSRGLSAEAEMKKYTFVSTRQAPPEQQPPPGQPPSSQEDVTSGAIPARRTRDDRGH